jgi:hypothetical protein
MVMEVTRKGRATVSHTANGMNIVIPSKKNILLIIFLMAWLGGWVCGLVMVGGSLFSEGESAPRAFNMFWLVGWTAGGAIAALVLGWNLTGKEIVTANPTTLKMDKSVMGIHFRKSFNNHEIKEIRVIDRAMPSGFGNHEDFLFFRSGRIAFDYGMKTYRFAQGVEEAEARYLIDLLRQSGYLSK